MKSRDVWDHVPIEIPVAEVYNATADWYSNEKYRIGLHTEGLLDKD